jgi:hypothetical protein
MPITTPTPEPNPATPPAPDNLLASEVMFQPDLPEEKEGTPFTCICANRDLRQKWQKARVIDHASEEVWCMAGYTYSQQLAKAENQSKPSKSFNEMLPEPYREFKKMFSEEESARLPEHQSWDHTIDLISGALSSLKTKIYLMSLNKQAELDKFLQENLKKGYI